MKVLFIKRISINIDCSLRYHSYMILVLRFHKTNFSVYHESNVDFCFINLSSRVCLRGLCPHNTQRRRKKHQDLHMRSSLHSIPFILFTLEFVLILLSINYSTCSISNNKEALDSKEHESLEML